MEVSTFELIFKPQSPAAPAGTTAVERVIQGYFLAITNLEAQAYRFALDFVIAPPPATTPDVDYRSLAGNTLVFVDIPGADNTPGVLNGTLTSSVFRPSTGFINIPAQATALVAVLPSAFGPTPLDPTPLTLPKFEVRGYVRIRLPAVRPPAPPFTLFTVAQSSTPVKVLLTPQHRATFLTATGAISDQIQATLPLASGQALNAIEPEAGGPLILQPLPLPLPLPSVLLEAQRLLDTNPEMANSGMLAALMGQLDPTQSNLTQFNQALADLQIPFAIERRNR